MCHIAHVWPCACSLPGIMSTTGRWASLIFVGGRWRSAKVVHEYLNPLSSFNIGLITTTFHSNRQLALSVITHSLPTTRIPLYSVPSALWAMRETRKLNICLHFSLSRLMPTMEGVGILFMGRISMESCHPKSCLASTLRRTVLVDLWRSRVYANHPL